LACCDCRGAGCRCAQTSKRCGHGHAAGPERSKDPAAAVAGRTSRPLAVR